MPQIKLQHLKNKCIIISASEMLSLTVYFGILIGDLVSSDEPAWRLYILLFEIMEILLGDCFTQANLEYLSFLIREHHIMFQELFNETLKPKYHIMLHYPDIILKIGPPRRIWSMRYEAFHKFLKSVVNGTTSRRNILEFIFLKDSLKFSHRILSKKGFSNNMKIGPLEPDIDLSLYELANKLNTSYKVVSWVTVNNIFL